MTTAQEHRAEAARLDAKAEESFQRCDTDGFLSQWAMGITANKHRLQADIDERGGTDTFLGLFTTEGVRVKAKLVTVPCYSRPWEDEQKWLVLDANDKALAWVPRNGGVFSNLTGIREDGTEYTYGSTWTPGPPSKRSKMGKMGLEERYEQAPARAAIHGSGHGLSGQAWATVERTDAGYPDDAVVYDTKVVTE